MKYAKIHVLGFHVYPIDNFTWQEEFPNLARTSKCQANVQM